MAQPELAKARLIPYEGERPNPDESEHVVVHFNPASLKITLANTLKADAKAKGKRGTAAQFVEKSSSSLNVELVFDTSIEQTDVRAETQKVAERFMKPQGEGEKPGPPKRCRLQWGAFAFDGMVSNYAETLDFFAPEGIPLRATLALTLQEDKYQFERDPAVVAARRALPKFAGTMPESSMADASQSAGKDPAEWRDTALYNGVENPRSSGGSGADVPREPPPSRPGQGYSYGDSENVGTGVPGAF